MITIKKNLKKLWILVFAILFMGSINAQDEEEYIKTTVKGTEYEVVGWETDVVYNPNLFTWFAWEEPIMKKKTTKKIISVPVSEFDRPPVFSAECLDVADQFACSNKKLQEYVAENPFRYPDDALEKEQSGLEYVTFTLGKDGTFESNLKVMSKKDPCEDCAEAAVDIVADMEEMWFPAIKDGKTVKTQLTIPVRFKILENEFGTY